MNVLRTIFAAVGAVVIFGGFLALLAVATYHVERRFR